MPPKKAKTKQADKKTVEKKEQSLPAPAPVVETVPDQAPLPVPEPLPLPVPPPIPKQPSTNSQTATTHDHFYGNNAPIEGPWGAPNDGWAGNSGAGEDGGPANVEGGDDWGTTTGQSGVGWGNNDGWVEQNLDYTSENGDGVVENDNGNHHADSGDTTPIPPRPPSPQADATPTPPPPPVPTAASMPIPLSSGPQHAKLAPPQHQGSNPPPHAPKSYTYASAMANRSRPASQPATSAPPSNRPSYYWTPNQPPPPKQPMSTTKSQQNPALRNLSAWGEPKNVDPWGDPKPQPAPPPAPAPAPPPPPLYTADQQRPAWYDWGRTPQPQPQHATKVPPRQHKAALSYDSGYDDHDDYDSEDGYEYIDDDRTYTSHDAWGHPSSIKRGEYNPRKHSRVNHHAPPGSDVGARGRTSNPSQAEHAKMLDAMLNNVHQSLTGHYQQPQRHHPQKSAAYRHAEMSYHEMEKARRLHQLAEDQRRMQELAVVHGQKHHHHQGSEKSTKKRNAKHDTWDGGGWDHPKDEWASSGGRDNNDGVWSRSGEGEGDGWNGGGNSGEDGWSNGGGDTGWGESGNDGWQEKGGDGWGDGNGDARWGESGNGGWAKKGGDGWGNGNGDHRGNGDGGGKTKSKFFSWGKSKKQKPAQDNASYNGWSNNDSAEVWSKSKSKKQSQDNGWDNGWSNNDSAEVWSKSKSKKQSQDNGWDNSSSNNDSAEVWSKSKSQKQSQDNGWENSWSNNDSAEVWSKSKTKKQAGHDVWDSSRSNKDSTRWGDNDGRNDGEDDGSSYDDEEEVDDWDETTRYHVVTDSTQHKSNALIHAMNVQQDSMPSMSSKLGLPPGALNESGNRAFEPAMKAIFGKERLAKDRIHWAFSPAHEPQVGAMLSWIQQMESHLAFFGLLKFLETQERGALFVNVSFRLKEYPDRPAFDWLRYEQVQVSADRILQHSILAADPAQQTIVFVFLPSRTGNSVAMWRRKLQVPSEVSQRHMQVITKVKAGLRPEKDYRIHVDELPPVKERKAKSARLSKTNPKQPSLKQAVEPAKPKPAIQHHNPTKQTNLKPAKSALKAHHRTQSQPIVTEKKRKWWQILRFAD
ncbi:hypothetical protein H0H93_008390 [Arthromyces matolae]|nr:hypothetical protein H0H93_008390 [Arthromyces matolae]